MASFLSAANQSSILRSSFDSSREDPYRLFRSVERSPPTPLENKKKKAKKVKVEKKQNENKCTNKVQKKQRCKKGQRGKEAAGGGKQMPRDDDEQSDEKISNGAVEEVEKKDDGGEPVAGNTDEVSSTPAKLGLGLVTETTISKSVIFSTPIHPSFRDAKNIGLSASISQGGALLLCSPILTNGDYEVSEAKNDSKEITYDNTLKVTEDPLHDIVEDDKLNSGLDPSQTSQTPRRSSNLSPIVISDDESVYEMQHETSQLVVTENISTKQKSVHEDVTTKTVVSEKVAIDVASKPSRTDAQWRRKYKVRRSFVLVDTLEGDPPRTPKKKSYKKVSPEKSETKKDENSSYRNTSGIISGDVPEASSPSRAISTSPKSPNAKQAYLSYRKLSLNALFHKTFERLNQSLSKDEETSSPSKPKKLRLEDDVAVPEVTECQVVLKRIGYEEILPLVIPEFPISFEWLLENWNIEIDSKIGEGSFAEVFKVKHFVPEESNFLHQSYASHASLLNSDHHTAVLKVVRCNGSGQPSFKALIPEMTMCLAGRALFDGEDNRAPTFIGLMGIHLVRGVYAPAMVEAYQRFSEDSSNDCEHIHPHEIPVDQYFVALLTSYDGEELEKILDTLTIEEKGSILLQIIYGLAAAECGFDFEHRDLHLSNLVVSRTTVESLEFVIEGEQYLVRTSGVRVALIDYGMSRLSVDDIYYTSFSNSILTGKDLQRKTYRLQHELLEGNYKKSNTKTNGLWIKFVFSKLFKTRVVPKKHFFSHQLNRLIGQLSEESMSAYDCVQVFKSFEAGCMPCK